MPSAFDTNVAAASPRILWEREDLATLRSFATDYRSSGPEHGDGFGIERWTVRFPLAEPRRLTKGTLKATYTAKPLVTPFGQPLFGELAILRCLEVDGWSGVWVDTYHGSELFWRDMPHESKPVRPAEAPLSVYRNIVTIRGKRGGFFDVFAWRDSDLLFVEYKGKGDRANANERSWIEAVLRSGIKPSQLLVAEYASKAT